MWFMPMPKRPLTRVLGGPVGMPVWLVPTTAGQSEAYLLGRYCLSKSGHQIVAPRGTYASGGGVPRISSGTMCSVLSSAYMTNATPICLELFKQAMPRALLFALLNAGRSRPARIAMIAMTTSNSIKVNPALQRLEALIGITRLNSLHDSLGEVRDKDKAPRAYLTLTGASCYNHRSRGGRHSLSSPWRAGPAEQA